MFPATISLDHISCAALPQQVISLKWNPVSFEDNPTPQLFHMMCSFCHYKPQNCESAVWSTSRTCGTLFGSDSFGAFHSWWLPLLPWLQQVVLRGVHGRCELSLLIMRKYVWVDGFFLSDLRRFDMPSRHPAHRMPYTYTVSHYLQCINYNSTLTVWNISWFTEEILLSISFPSWSELNPHEFFLFLKPPSNLRFRRMSSDTQYFSHQGR